MLYLLKKDSAKYHETHRGVAYNAKVCNQDVIVIGEVENQGVGGVTDIWIKSEHQDKWRKDLKIKGYELHNEDNLAEWMFDVDDGLIKTIPTEIPTLDELMAWEEIKYS